MKATLVHVTDPFRPQAGRRVHPIRRRVRVDTLLRRHGMIVGRGRKMRRLSHFIVLSGPAEALLAHEWKRCVHDGEVIAIVAVPAGGKLWRTIATVGLLAASAFVTAGIGGPLGAIAGAGVLLGGTALINAVLPPPKPAVGSMDNRSQNYGISAAGNQARLGEVIPVLYGRFRVTPNYAAQPYTEYDGNSRETLYALLCISQGSVDIEKILIGDTPIDNFSEVQYSVVEPGGSCMLFPDNVVTSDAVSGVELKAPDDLKPTDGEWVGPYVTNPAETQATELAIDYGYPQGLYRVNDKGKNKSANAPWIAQAQSIDDDDNPTGDWFTLEQADEWMENKQTNLFFTHRYTVSPGRYQVRMRKLQPDKDKGTVVNTLYWMGLRAYLPSKRTYGDCTLLEVKMQATSNLNGSTSHQINVLATRKLPVWNGASWSDPQPTRSIAWAAADVLRNSTYGRGWDDNRIDCAGLLALEQTWSQRGDEFNGVFDTKTTLWDALTSVLRCGRTMPVYYAGVVEFVRDQEQSLPTLVLAPQNITQDSFHVEYAFPTYDTADYVVVTYTDAQNWKSATVDCFLNGSAKQTPKNVTLMGCTSRDHAHREGMYMAACNRDQRKTVTVTTEMEGLIPRYGDLVDISHDVPAWGLSGEVVSYDADTGIFQLTEPVQWWPNQTHYLQLRSRNGGVQGPYQVSAGADDFHLVLQGAMDSQKNGIFVSDGVSEVPTIFQFGPGQNYAQECLVTKARPGSDNKVELTLVNYAPSVYFAENNASVPPPSSGSLLLNPPLAPAVGGVGVSEDPDTQTVWLSVDPVPGASAYEFQVSYDGGNSWISVGVSNTNSIQARIPAGHWIVRARAISGTGAGAWSQTPIDITGAPPKLGAVKNLTATGGVMQILLTWQLPDPIDMIGASAVEIWFGPSSDRSQAKILATTSLSANTYTLTNLPAGADYYFWLRIAGSDAGNYGPEIGPVSGSSSSDATQILGYINGQIGKTQLANDLLSEIDDTNGKVFMPGAGEVDRDSDGSAGNWTTMDSAGYYNYTIAYVDADRAATERMDTLTSTLNGNTAAVQTNAKAVSDVNGRLDATYTVKVQTTVDGKKYAAGIGAGVSNETGSMQSQVLFLADRLALLTSDAGGGTYTPFVIQNGQTFINEAFIANATIGGAKIKDELKSDSWDQGNGGIFMNFRNGYAHFSNVEVDGNVSAQSITGHFQQTAQGQRDDSVYGPPEGSSDIITLMQIDLPPPYRGDQQHVPQLSANFDTYADRNHKTAICGIVIQRDYNDNNWQTVRSSNIGLHGNNSGSFTLQWMGDRTGSYTRYRLALTELGQNDHADQVLFSTFYMSAVGIV